MGEKKEKDKKQPVISLTTDLLRMLAGASEIELEDVELEFDELELQFLPSGVRLIPRMAPPAVKEGKPAQLLEVEYVPPKQEYPGRIVEVKLGATKAEGGTRGRSIVIGGETAPAFYLFHSSTSHKPVIAFDVFDTPKVSLPGAVKRHVREVLEDPAAWARLCVEKFGAEMINLHLVSVDPLIEDASPEKALKTVESVLEAVDVPLAVGGCGDPAKDLKVFEKVAAATAGERLLFNSVTLDMDIEKTAKLIKQYDHTVIAFTSMDVNRARELNRKLYEFLPREQIVMDTTTAALGYGLDYGFTVMERARIAGLKGDPELQQPLSSGTTNAWAAREAWMTMDSQWEPKELRGPLWETTTAVALLLVGVDYFMMMHPAAARTLKTIVDELMGGRKEENTAVDWASLRI